MSRILYLTVVAAILFFCVFGCRQYGDVSEHAYEHAEALFSACSRQDATQLTSVRQSLETARAEENMGEQEFHWLIAIVEQAEAGDWQTATTNARQLMLDQVKP